MDRGWTLPFESSTYGKNNLFRKVRTCIWNCHHESLGIKSLVVNFEMRVFHHLPSEGQLLSCRQTTIFTNLANLVLARPVKLSHLLDNNKICSSFSWLSNFNTPVFMEADSYSGSNFSKEVIFTRSDWATERCTKNATITPSHISSITISAIDRPRSTDRRNMTHWRFCWCLDACSTTYLDG